MKYIAESEYKWREGNTVLKITTEFETKAQRRLARMKHKKMVKDTPERREHWEYREIDG